MFRLLQTLLPAVAVTLATTAAISQLPPPQAGPRQLQAASTLPLQFEPNRGQTDAAVQFLARAPQATVFVSGADAVIRTSEFRADAQGKARLAGSSSVRMHLAGANPVPAAAPEDALPGKVNYMRGNDRSRWQTGVPTYSGVRLASVYPGVDLRYYGHSGQLEYDFIVAPQADPNAVKLVFEGAAARVEPNGDLLLPLTGKGVHGEPLRFDKPVAYQTIDGRRVAVEASFELAADKNVSFKLGAYDHSRELVIDPTLVYLGTLGAGVYPNSNTVAQMVVDAAGALYFVGTTDDATFPTTAGAYQTVCGPANATAAANNVAYCNPANYSNNYTSAYVTKLSADGTKLIYSTYLSGHGGVEGGSGIAVDSAGVAYLLGYTISNDFPVTSDAFQKLCQPGQPSGFQPQYYVPTAQCDNFHNGGGTQYTINGPEAFFAKLSANGSSLTYASFLGGTLPVYPTATALDASGNWYIAVQTAIRPPNDLYGLGGGNVQYPGVSQSGYQTTTPPGIYADNAVAVSRFSSDGHTLLYGTFLGDISTNVPVLPLSFTVGQNGFAFVGGFTQAANLPTTAGAVKKSCTQVNPGSPNNCTTTDGFVAAFDTTKFGAASLAYLTRIGGSNTTAGSNSATQQVLGLAADFSNNAYLTGYTSDHTFPIPATGYQAACPNAYPNPAPGDNDYCNSAFVLKLNPTGTAILGGSFLDGKTPRAAGSAGYNVRLDSKGQVYLYGSSNDGAGDFPTVNPLQGYKGGNQLFISTFSTDFTKLLFSTRFGNPSYTDHSVSVAGGLVLDSADNIYFAGQTNDPLFAGTTGTYNTSTAGTGGAHAFFVKLSKLLQPTATTLTVPTAPVNQGSSYTLSAKVAGTLQTAPAATGTVTFSYTNTTPATVAGTATLDATGTATLTAVAPPAGTYTVVAAYAGDANYDVSTSAAGTVTSKTLVTPTITLGLSATTGNPATSFTFTATLPAAGGNTPTGTVYFMDGANGTTTLGSMVLSGGSAAYSTTLAIGSHSITARYSGDTNFAAQTSAAQAVTVTMFAPLVALGSSAGSISTGASVTFTAAVSAGGATTAATGSVTFLDGATLIGTGTLASGSATFSTTALTTGSHSITARYAGDSNYAAASSGAQTVTVVANASTIALTSSAASVAAGMSLTLTATVKATSSALAPAGSVTFLDGATVLGTGSVSNGTASYTTSALTAGTHSLTATYGGDANFAGSTSAPYTQTVTPVTGQQGTIVLTATPTTLTIKRGITGTVLVTATPTGGPVTGTLSFACGNVPRHASCLFNPATLVFNNSTAVQTTTLSFATNVAALVMPANPLMRGNRMGEVVAAGLFLPLGLLALARRRKGLRLSVRMGLMVLALAGSLGLMGVTGCGGDSSFNDVVAGSYTVPVTATVNGTTSTLNVTIVVTD